MTTKGIRRTPSFHTIYVLTPVFDLIMKELQRHWVMPDTSYVVAGDDVLFREVLDSPIVLNGEPRELLAHILMIDQTSPLASRNMVCLGFDINYPFGEYALSRLSDHQ